MEKTSDGSVYVYMSREVQNVEITNMIMIEDRETGKAVVQHRRLYWCGICFPGGHVEKGESFIDSAVREVYEETGLTVKNLKLCGTVNWVHAEDNSRYIVLCYKTSDYSGTLKKETYEGEVFWQDIDKIPQMDLCPHFEDYLKIFLGQASEFYGIDYRGKKQNEITLH